VCPRLKARKLYPTAAEVTGKLLPLSLAGEAESTYSFSDSRSSDMIAFTAPQLQPCLTAGFILAYGTARYWLRNSCPQFHATFCPLLQPSLATPNIVHISPLPREAQRDQICVGPLPDQTWGHQLPVQCPCVCH